MKHLVDKFATIISDLSIPLFPAAITIIIISYFTAPNLAQFFLWAIIGLLFLVFIPFFYVWWEYKKGRITNIRLVKRTERIKPLVFALLSAMVAMTILYQLTASFQIIVFGLIYIINGLIVLVITKFYKISIHLAVLTACIVGLAIIIDGWILAFLFLLPMVGWARVYKNRHTLGQVLLSLLISAFTTVLILYLFGYF